MNTNTATEYRNLRRGGTLHCILAARSGATLQTIRIPNYDLPPGCDNVDEACSFSRVHLALPNPAVCIRLRDDPLHLLKFGSMHFEEGCVRWEVSAVEARVWMWTGARDDWDCTVAVRQSTINLILAAIGSFYGHTSYSDLDLLTSLWNIDRQPSARFSTVFHSSSTAEVIANVSAGIWDCGGVVSMPTCVVFAASPSPMIPWAL